MTENLAAAASALDAPEDLVKRSAEAKAKATGESVEAILAGWAGGTAPTPSATAPAAPTPAAPAPAPVAGEPEPEPAIDEVTPPAPTEPAAPAPAAATPPPPAPARVSPKEALAHPVVVSVPTAGLEERTNTSLPRWLAVAFLVIPVFGLLYLAGGSDGCTEGGFELAANRVTGIAQNCDGSEFEGRGTAGGGAAFLSVGEQLYSTCAACHGANGGGGVGPSLATVLNNFSSCAAQVEWVNLGSRGFTAAGNTTYGDLGTPIAGGMPGFAGSLSPEQVASVVAFERVRFGGAEPEQVLVDCGLVEPESDGADPSDTSTTEPGMEAGN